MTSNDEQSSRNCAQAVKWTQAGAKLEPDNWGGKFENRGGGRFFPPFATRSVALEGAKRPSQIGWGSRGTLKRPWPRRRRNF